MSIETAAGVDGLHDERVAEQGDPDDVLCELCGARLCCHADDDVEPLTDTVGGWQHPDDVAAKESLSRWEEIKEKMPQWEAMELIDADAVPYLEEYWRNRSVTHARRILTMRVEAEKKGCGHRSRLR
eukprot:GHVR01183129.1.p1 GENE.GHVR01183129.1~~GHVR01183129.1.p1  ORF type:complete len:127 (+),score=27.65 GHVR01183129.1:279-659(+)